MSTPGFSCSDFTPGCIRCGGRPRYEHVINGMRRVFKLCAVCAWNNVKRAVALDPDPKEPLR